MISLSTSKNWREKGKRKALVAGLSKTTFWLQAMCMLASLTNSQKSVERSTDLAVNRLDLKVRSRCTLPCSGHFRPSTANDRLDKEIHSDWKSWPHRLKQFRWLISRERSWRSESHFRIGKVKRLLLHLVLADFGRIIRVRRSFPGTHDREHVVRPKEGKNRSTFRREIERWAQTNSW